jgi:hypothetical protein
MKKQVPEKLYFFLTGEERFRLCIEALYRGDESEASRLNEECPRERYSMNQGAYTDRLRASREIVNMLGSALAPRLARLEMIEAFQEALPSVFDICITKSFFGYLNGHQEGSRRAWAAAGMTGDPPGWRGQEEPEMDRELQSLRRIIGGLEEASGGFLSYLAELECELTEEVLTIWEAFAHFCTEELLLQPEKLVKVWYEPMVSEIEKLKDLSGSTGLNPEMLEEWEAAFKEMWNEVVGPDKQSQHDGRSA